MDTKLRKQYMATTEDAITAIENALSRERDTTSRNRIQTDEITTLKLMDATDDAIWDLECALISERAAWLSQLEELNSIIFNLQNPI